MKNHKEYLDKGKIILNVADGTNGYAENGPYDIIHLGGASIDIYFYFFLNLY